MTRPVSVLVVDDNDLDRFLVKKNLGRTNFKIPDDHIFEATDGFEALEFLKDDGKNRPKQNVVFPPSFIFLDINMPGLNAWGFLEKYKNIAEKPEYASTVIVVLTSSENHEDRQRASQYPFVKEFVVKPIIRDDLQKLLSNYI